MAYGNIFLILFLTLFCYLFNNPCYSESDTLHQGQELKDWDELVSSNKVFSLKFFSFGTTQSPYLGVFYRNNQIRSRYLDDLRVLLRNNQFRLGYNYRDVFSKTTSDDFSNTPVWVANRNKPIPDIGGKLIVDINTRLSILSSGGTVLDLFSPNQVVARNASVTLLDSGNLVLQELHPDGSVKQVLWQSFDYPTDTLLPGMKLGVNLKTGHTWSLTSRRNDELPAEGLFTLVGNHNGTGQMAILRQRKIHRMSGHWKNGQFKNTDLQSSGPNVRLYYISNETEQSFTYLTRTYDLYPSLRMLQDDQLMGSSLNLNLKCRSINDPPGCAEDEFEKLNCRKDYNFGPRISYGGYKVYSYLDEYVFDESYNLYDCKRICWNNCSCVAYTTTRNRVGCKTYSKMVHNPDSTEEADGSKEYYTIDYHGEGKRKNKTWIGLIIMIVPLVVLLSCYWVYKNIDVKGIAKNIKKLLLLQMRRVYLKKLGIAKNIKKLLLLQMRRVYGFVRADKNINTELHYFTFQSISSATNNFSNTNKLGKGGFGEVYKGKLVDGQEVAVKRLSRSSGQGVKEFKNETELIAKLQHTNLVRLLGCLLGFTDPRKKELLDWNSRFVIIDGIAQGLLYLHKFSRLRIIHRDLKASNILLDDYLKPKISDFGMAKLFGINESEANTSRVVGTRGYMPPEYMLNGTISTKIDVFSFGVLLLEIVSSKMNFASYDVDHPLNLLGLAWELWDEGRGLELMDPVLEDTCTPKEVMTCIHVGLLCVQEHAMDRPTMLEVVSMLTNENMHLPEPKRPAFYIERHETETGTEAGSEDKLVSRSENGESISILVSK